MTRPETTPVISERFRDWARCLLEQPVTCSVRLVGVLLIVMAILGLIGAALDGGEAQTVVATADATAREGTALGGFVAPLVYFVVGLLFLAPDLPRMGIAMFLLFVFLTSTLLLIIPVKDVVGIVAQNKGVKLAAPRPDPASLDTGGDSARGVSATVVVTGAQGRIELRPGMVARTRQGKLMALYKGKTHIEPLRPGSLVTLNRDTRKDAIKKLGKGKKGSGGGVGGYFFVSRDNRLTALPQNYFLGTIKDGELFQVVYEQGLQRYTDGTPVEPEFDTAYLEDYVPGRFISINNGILTNYRPEQGFGVPLSLTQAVHVSQEGSEVRFAWLKSGDGFVIGKLGYIFQDGVISAAHGGSGLVRAPQDTPNQIYEVLLRNLDKAVPIILAILMGALGSAVVISHTFVDDYNSRKPLWYFYRLFQGMVMAILVIFGFSAGMLSVSTVSFEDGGPFDASNYEQTKYLIGFASALAGLFSDRAFNKLAEISQTMFGTADTAPGTTVKP